MANLTNSTTKVLRASYAAGPSVTVPLSGGAVRKSTFVQQLNLQPGEVDAVQSTLSTTDAAATNYINRDNPSFWTLLRQFEGTPLSSQIPSPSAFVNVTDSDLTAFGNALVTLRQQAVESLKQTTAAPLVSTDARASSTDTAQKLGSALNLLNRAVVANKGLANSITASPVGWLNLERLEMTPAGIERGDLIATVPLAPKEHTFVAQKEWSVISQEFTTIVTDSLDNYSETGVTENTQLAQSTTSQVAHNNQSNVTASASGGVNFVVASGSASGSTSFTSQDQNSTSATASRQNAITTTRNASTRVRSSHKTTISTTTVTGTSQSTTRKIENPSATDPMRIDYFSLMRKWYVALYRYGLRLTYDVTVPEPGAALREIYANLARLQSQANEVFTFPIKHSDITPGNYLVLADKYSVDVPPPPEAEQIQPVNDLEFSGGHVGYKMKQITVPDGCWISKIIFTNLLQGGGVHIVFTPINGNGLEYSPDHNHDPGTIDPTMSPQNDLCNGGIFLYHATGTVELAMTYTRQTTGTGFANFLVHFEPTDVAMSQWTSSVWTALYNAAQSQFYARQQSINAQISALQNQLSNVDTLTLRREENDEIMRCVLRWLLGPNFAFMPNAVTAAYSAAAKAAASGDAKEEEMHLEYGLNFLGSHSGITPSEWTVLSGNEDVINFINQAIEWENVVFFTYSYFWDEPLCWDFIRQIQHPDKTRQAFLRAGSARVVLTVRPGWETAWVNFVENFQTKLPSPLPSAPYMTIAQQIEAYNSTNYPGIPPANPGGGGLVDDDTPQIGTTCTSTADTPASKSPVTIPVADNTGFVLGATAIIDVWGAGIPANGIIPPYLGIGGAQETQTITAVSAPSAPPTITVQALQYPHTGAFPVVQAGAKGVLIGEWFEYTPSSGTDIAVTINQTSVAAPPVVNG